MHRFTVFLLGHKMIDQLNSSVIDNDSARDGRRFIFRQLLMIKMREDFFCSNCLLKSCVVCWHGPMGRIAHLKSINTYMIISKYYLREEKLNGSHLQTWIPFTQGCFMLSLIEIGPGVLEKKIFKFCQCIFAIS